MLKILVALFLAAAPSVGTTSAGAAERPFFSYLDTDGDGVISSEEAAQNPRIGSKFQTADVNQDGRLDRAEFFKEIVSESTRPQQS